MYTEQKQRCDAWDAGKEWAEKRLAQGLSCSTAEDHQGVSVYMAVVGSSKRVPAEIKKDPVENCGWEPHGVDWYQWILKGVWRVTDGPDRSGPSPHGGEEWKPVICASTGKKSYTVIEVDHDIR